MFGSGYVMSFRLFCLGPCSMYLCRFFSESVGVGSFRNVYSFTHDLLIIVTDLPLVSLFNLCFIATCYCIIVLLFL